MTDFVAQAVVLHEERGWKPCPNCTDDGETTPDTESCRRCEGSGQVAWDGDDWRDAEEAARDRAMDLKMESERERRGRWI